MMFMMEPADNPGELWQIEPPPGLGVAGHDVHVVSPEERFRQELSVLELDKFITFVVDEVERRSIEDSKLCEYVNQKMKFLTRYHVMRAIRKEAEHDLQALRQLCGNAI